MPQLSISQVARRVGLRPSAIRYYEQIGILLPAERVYGQRRYDSSIVQRLAVIQAARQAGFTLAEVRQLFFGFRPGTPAFARWRKLSQRKLAELDEMVAQIRAVQGWLRKMQQECDCNVLEECGRGMLERGCAEIRPRLRRAHSI